MNGIVVGVDESTFARAALRWAAAYGAECNIPVTAVLAWDYILQHHVEPDVRFDPRYGEEMAAKVLDELVVRALGPDHTIDQRVINDRAEHALIEAAGDDAAAIVVGARGMSGFKGLLLGSVSRYVLHTATCPVIVIRDEAERTDLPVVVGVDGSEPSQRALAWAVDYARCRSLPVVALHAWVVPYSPFGLYAPPDLGKQAQAATRFLDDELAGIDESGLVAPIERRVVEQRAITALLEASAGASIVVVGSRGRGQVTRMLLGSVSEQLSHHANCPVAVIP